MYASTVPSRYANFSPNIHIYTRLYPQINTTVCYSEKRLEWINPSIRHSPYKFYEES